MREIVHLQAGQCGNQIGAKVCVCVFNPPCWSFFAGFVVPLQRRKERSSSPLEELSRSRPGDKRWKRPAMLAKDTAVFGFGFVILYMIDLMVDTMIYETHDVQPRF